MNALCYWTHILYPTLVSSPAAVQAMPAIAKYLLRLFIFWFLLSVLWKSRPGVEHLAPKRQLIGCRALRAKISTPPVREALESGTFGTGADISRFHSSTLRISPVGVFSSSSPSPRARYSSTLISARTSVAILILGIPVLPTPFSHSIFTSIDSRTSFIPSPPSFQGFMQYPHSFGWVCLSR